MSTFIRKKLPRFSHTGTMTDLICSLSMGFYWQCQERNCGFSGMETEWWSQPRNNCLLEKICSLLMKKVFSTQPWCQIEALSKPKRTQCYVLHGQHTNNTYIPYLCAGEVSSGKQSISVSRWVRWALRWTSCTLWIPLPQATLKNCSWEIFEPQCTVSHKVHVSWSPCFCP